MSENRALRERVEDLAALRDHEYKAALALKRAEAEFRLQTANLFSAARETREKREELEASIRAEAELEFRQWGDRNPAPGVTIQLRKRLEYDEREALQWAFDHEACLTLDRRTFESDYARQLPFVEEVNNPTVAISQNLFGAFEAERQEATRGERDGNDGGRRADVQEGIERS